ncbi:MAG: primosomal protein N' [Clostridia bacterium]|nr:primosomal protein N' [Clostridia bacterium]
MIAEVIVDISTSEIDKIFDYVAPPELDLRAGDRVKVPFGRQQTEGFIVKIKENPDTTHALKSVTSKLDDFTPILPEMLELMREMSREYNLRLVDVLRLFIPAMMRGGRIREIKRHFVTLADGVSYEAALSRLKPNAVNQRGVIASLGQGGEWAAILGEEYGFSAVSALAEKGLVKVTEVTKRRRPALRPVEDKRVTLNDEQAAAAREIMHGDKDSYLLFGVTGSGKTEIYLECIEEVLSAGKTAIMLVPEISLTPQMMGRFRARFGDKVAVLHSGLSDGERYDEWLRLLRGDAVIAIGARSAVFAPLRNVGIIIIDEEHDGSYISENNPRYVTSEVAELRRAYNGAKLVVGSATPALETFKKAREGKLGLITLKNRVNGTGMPEICVVDMCAELRGGNNGFLSEELAERLEQTLADGNQSMIFLNRRGFASFMICRKCGHVMKCEDCDVSLTWHKEDNLLKCHYCGKPYAVPNKCPACGETDMRLGRVGTERVIEELHRRFPSARTLRMDKDTTRKKGSYDEILSAFRMGEADILVGTQMIVKGHDFPNVTLVGILDADMSLYYEDYHSAERTYQLVSQMSGRAGRADKAGVVVLQTYSPRHYVFLYAKENDYEGFFRKEINVREVTNFPPFTKIVRVLTMSEDEERALGLTKEMLAKIRAYQKEAPERFVSVSGMKSPVKRIENKYRYQIIMRLTREEESDTLSHVYDIVNAQEKKNATVFVEINPQNMN